MTDSEYLKQMGMRIRAARKACGLSQRDIVKKYGLHKSTVSEIENGHFDTKILTLRKYAEMLNCDLKDFL